MPVGAGLLGKTPAMLNTLILTPFFMTLNPHATPVRSMELLDALERGWHCSAVLEEGDAGEHVLVVQVDNPGTGVNLLVDAGTAFQGPDDIQPSVIMEDMMVYVPPGSSEIVLGHPGCGAASRGSAGVGTAFDEGVYMISEELGRVLDRMNADADRFAHARQDMVWVYTDDHGYSSVYVEEQDQAALMALLEEEVEGFEAPGYAVRYREPEPEDEGRFTGEAMEMRCAVRVVLQRPERCRIVLITPEGEHLVMMENFMLHQGLQDITLTVGLEGYPAGDYTFEVEGQQTRRTHFTKEVTLQGQG